MCRPSYKLLCTLETVVRLSPSLGKGRFARLWRRRLLPVPSREHAGLRNGVGIAQVGTAWSAGASTPNSAVMCRGAEHQRWTKTTAFLFGVQLDSPFSLPSFFAISSRREFIVVCHPALRLTLRGMTMNSGLHIWYLKREPLGFKGKERVDWKTIYRLESNQNVSNTLGSTRPNYGINCPITYVRLSPCLDTFPRHLTLKPTLRYWPMLFVR